MARGRGQSAEDEPAGAPEWMVTFSDCMTLLLTFFVLLLSFSSFDTLDVFKKLKIVFAKDFNAVSERKLETKESLNATDMPEYLDDLYQGSEKPTLARGKADHMRKDTEPTDFRSQKTFFVASSKVFWGKGSIISFDGKDALSDMASFLKEVPSRIVISENRKGRNSTERLGLERAWEVLDYFITEHGLDRNRFSISAAGTISSQMGVESETNAERILEIVLLERSIYN